MIQISDHAEGCILPVRAQPGARRSELIGEHGGALKVSVTAQPEQGRANAAIVELLSDRLKLKKGLVELHSGAASRNKTFLIRSRTAAQITAELSRLLASAPDKTGGRESKSR